MTFRNDPIYPNNPEGKNNLPSGIRAARPASQHPTAYSKTQSHNGASGSSYITTRDPLSGEIVTLRHIATI